MSGAKPVGPGGGPHKLPAFRKGLVLWRYQAKKLVPSTKVNKAQFKALFANLTKLNYHTRKTFIKSNRTFTEKIHGKISDCLEDLEACDSSTKLSKVAQAFKNVKLNVDKEELSKDLVQFGKKTKKTMGTTFDRKISDCLEALKTCKSPEELSKIKKNFKHIKLLVKLEKNKTKLSERLTRFRKKTKKTMGTTFDVKISDCLKALKTCKSPEDLSKIKKNFKHIKLLVKLEKNKTKLSKRVTTLGEKTGKTFTGDIKKKFDQKISGLQNALKTCKSPEELSKIETDFKVLVKFEDDTIDLSNRLTQLSDKMEKTMGILSPQEIRFCLSRLKYCYSPEELSKIENDFKVLVKFEDDKIKLFKRLSQFDEKIKKEPRSRNLTKR